MLNASFLAVVQVVVYIGAIAILFIFAVMLTRRDMRDTGSAGEQELVARRIAGRADLRRAVLPASELERLVEDGCSAIPSGFDAITELGKALTSPDAVRPAVRSRVRPAAGGVGWRGLRRVQ
ncbi:MAG: NADH-quinone oxidoreductase subunit J [Candidatus Moduliflexus flocculans]|nr:NADH-quinone oxidoreductase subunit J [Candidatus Moduliflexus flocculans]